MAWSGGNFTRANPTWTSDANFGIGIEAGRHDAQDNDFTTGIDQCLNKTGQNSMTGDLNLGGYRPTNVAAGTAAAPAVCVGNDVNTGIFSPAADNWAVATNGTERVRVDSSGRVGIGTTSPTADLHIQSTQGQVLIDQFSANGNGGTFVVRKSRGASVGTNTIVQGGDTLGGIYFQGANGTTYNQAASIEGLIDATPGASNDMPGRLSFSTTADGAGSTTERMRIDSAGCVGIATASTAYRLQVEHNSGNTGYFTGFTIVSKNTGTDYPMAGFNIKASGTGYVYNSSDYAAGFYYGSTGILRARTAASGTAGNTLTWTDGPYVANLGTSWTNASDERLKDITGEIQNSLSKVCSLRAAEFTWKNSANTKPQVGLIAQDVLAVLPEVVVVPEKEFDGTSETALGINYDQVIPLLVGAIKELNAKVESLEARVAELEK